MKLPTLLLVTLALIWSACGQGTSPDGENENGVPTDSTQQVGETDDGWERTEVGNYKFQHHVQNEGPKPAPGNIVQYYYRIFQGPVLMMDNFGGNPIGAYFPEDEASKANPKPIEEALRRMSPGDSLTLISRFSTEPEGFYRYEIKVVNIVTLDEGAPPPPQAKDGGQPTAPGQ